MKRATIKCLEKIPFSDRKSAVDQADKYRRKTGKRFRVYRCPFCNLWHITSKQKSKVLRRRNGRDVD